MNTITKILDMVPDMIDRFTTKDKGDLTEEDVADLLDQAEKEEEE